MSALSDDLKIELWDVAHALADAARPIALKYFRNSGQGLINKNSAGFDPVTVADQSIEQEMRRILAERRPQDGILGEEFAPISGTSGFTWGLDPIDGTRGFISGTPTWGVLIAVNARQGPVLGIVDQPYTEERFVGGFGQAALFHKSHKKRLNVRSCSDLSDAILFSTFPEIGTQHQETAFKKVAQACKMVRYGTDCYAYALLAAGCIDLVIEAGLNAFDIQAPMALIENAGGIVTNWQGGPAHQGGEVIAAGNARIHVRALDLLNS